MLNIQILLAEDSIDLAETMKDLLDAQGYDVVVARNGMEVLQHPTLDSFDLIIMDIDMPVMGGIQATSRLRASGFTAPIVAYSGTPALESRSDFRAAGFSAHSSKPVDFSEFVNLLQSLLTKQHSASAPGPLITL